MRQKYRLSKTEGDVDAMRQFVILGIFILIGVIVYANIFVSAGQVRVSGESANATFSGANDTYTVAYATGGIYPTPVAIVYADGTAVNGGTVTTNWSMNYGTGVLTIYVTADTNNTAITVDYTRSGAGNEPAGKTTIDNLNTTWYNSVNLLVIVFLVIAAVVILAYVSRIGTGGQ